MSSKQQLAEMVASLPESSSLEEAFEKLYEAFKAKMARDSQPRKLGLLKGHVRMSDDFDAPLPDSVIDQFEGRA